MRLCVTRNTDGTVRDAYGPFTQRMIQDCRAQSGGTACSRTWPVSVNGVAVQLMRWGGNFASTIRGTGVCPAGSTPDASLGGNCVEGDDVFGPFSVSLTRLCRAQQGGLACLVSRWSKSMYLWLRRLEQNSAAPNAVVSARMQCTMNFNFETPETLPQCPAITEEELAVSTEIGNVDPDLCSACRGRCCFVDAIDGIQCGLNASLPDRDGVCTDEEVEEVFSRMLEVDDLPEEEPEESVTGASGSASFAPRLILVGFGAAFVGFLARYL